MNKFMKVAGVRSRKRGRAENNKKNRNKNTTILRHFQSFEQTSNKLGLGSSNEDGENKSDQSAFSGHSSSVRLATKPEGRG